MTGGSSSKNNEEGSGKEEKKKDQTKSESAGGGKAEKQQEKEPTSLTEGVLDAVFPGIGRVIKELKKSEAFREKLEETNAEIENRIAGQSVDDTRRRPRVDFHFSVRTLVDGKEIYSHRTPGGFSQTRRVERRKLPPIRVVDILDEESQVVVIIELRRIEEKDVETEIQGETKMVLRVKSGGGTASYLTETELPSPVTTITGRKYSNGILEVRLRKKESGKKNGN
ncbi:MAG: hypothetical protein JRN68_07375 [Nitrososphaerota archaeon]|nr:hypothetical protein [Nitrososphaerota archaeon]